MKLVPHASVLLALALSYCAHADIIYGNFNGNTPDGSGGGWLVGYSFLGNNQGVAVPFTPSADYILDSIRLPLTIRTPTPNDTLQVQIASGDLVPSTILESFDFSFSGFSLLTATSTLEPELFGGSRYWIIVTFPDALRPDIVWGWGDSVNGIPTGDVAAKLGQSWTTYSNSLIPGVEVTGAAVPEPPSWQLGASGLFGLLVVGYKRAARSPVKSSIAL